jgi:hypothetical protein
MSLKNYQAARGSITSLQAYDVNARHKGIGASIDAAILCQHTLFLLAYLQRASRFNRPSLNLRFTSFQCEMDYVYSTCVFAATRLYLETRGIERYCVCPSSTVWYSTIQGLCT